MRVRPVVLGEVLGIERRERKVVGRAASGDPGVVVGAGAAPQLRACLESASAGGDCLVVLEHGEVFAPPCRASDPLRPPVP